MTIYFQKYYDKDTGQFLLVSPKNNLIKKSMAQIAVQASDAISANNYSNGAQTTINQKNSDGNAYGAYEVDVIANVTVGPSGGACSLEVHSSISYDNTNFTQYEYCITTVVPMSATGYFHIGTVSLSDYNRLKLKAVSYGLTASLIAVPILIGE